jgi:hypothetical protein
MTHKSLRALARALTLAAQALQDEAAHLNDAQPSAARGSRKRRPMSAKRRAQLRLQGQYIGFSRMLPVSQRARVRKEREKNGIHAAIRMAKRYGTRAAA